MKLSNMTPTCCDKEMGGVVSKEPVCIFIENGKHNPNVLTYEHREGYLFWIPSCRHCGFIDTDKILEEIKDKKLITCDTCKTITIQ